MRLAAFELYLFCRMSVVIIVIEILIMLYLRYR